MANLIGQYPNQYQNQYQMPSFNQKNLLQPVGQVFIINNSSELSTIPIIGTMSVVVCFNENLMYIKTIQNGMPTTLSYKMNEESVNEKTEEKKNNESETLLKDIVSRLEILEKKFKTMEAY